MNWHRIHRGIRGEPDPFEYVQKQAELEKLKQLEDTGEINLYYSDKTGFYLISVVSCD